MNEGKQDVIENLNVLLLILVLTLYGLFVENQIWWNDNLQICCKPLNYIHCQISPIQYMLYCCLFSYLNLFTVRIATTTA